MLGLLHCGLLFRYERDGCVEANLNSAATLCISAFAAVGVVRGMQIKGYKALAGDFDLDMDEGDDETICGLEDIEKD